MGFHSRSARSFRSGPGDAAVSPVAAPSIWSASSHSRPSPSKAGSARGSLPLASWGHAPSRVARIPIDTAAPPSGTGLFVAVTVPLAIAAGRGRGSRLFSLRAAITTEVRLPSTSLHVDNPGNGRPGLTLAYIPREIAARGIGCGPPRCRLRFHRLTAATTLCRRLLHSKARRGWTALETPARSPAPAGGPSGRLRDWVRDPRFLHRDRRAAARLGVSLLALRSSRWAASREFAACAAGRAETRPWRPECGGGAEWAAGELAFKAPWCWSRRPASGAGCRSWKLLLVHADCNRERAGA